MPSGRDESRGQELKRDAPSPEKETSSVADSVQSLRNLAENLSLPAINETEKKLKQVLEQLASMQENLGRLNNTRSRAQASAEQPEAKRKAAPRSASSNVIPFPVHGRPEEPSGAPPAIPDTKAPIGAPETPADIPLPEVEPPEMRPLVRDTVPGVREPPPESVNLPAEARGQESPAEATFDERPARDESASSPPDPPLTTESIPRNDEPTAVTPEVVADTELAVEERALSNRRSAAVDNEIRALMKEYGEVDIYSHRESGKKTVIKGFVAVIVLVAVLMASYLLFS